MINNKRYYYNLLHHLQKRVKITDCGDFYPNQVSDITVWQPQRCKSILHQPGMGTATSGENIAPYTFLAKQMLLEKQIPLGISALIQFLKNPKDVPESFKIGKKIIFAGTTYKNQDWPNEGEDVFYLKWKKSFFRKGYFVWGMKPLWKQQSYSAMDVFACTKK